MPKVTREMLDSNCLKNLKIKELFEIQKSAKSKIDHVKKERSELHEETQLCESVIKRIDREIVSRKPFKVRKIDVDQLNADQITLILESFEEEIKRLKTIRSSKPDSMRYGY